jgi:hypothetical protein
MSSITVRPKTRAIHVTADGEAFIGYGRREPPVFTLILD